MKPAFIFTLFAAGLAASCTSNAPYHPASPPEGIEFGQARCDVYPEDVRKDPARYAQTRVVWAGIISSNDVQEAESAGKFRLDTVLEHHYFAWKEDRYPGGVKLPISARGEGMFRLRWHVHQNDPEATVDDAAQYAAPGDLAMVYGTPESVDEDGTIVLRYHYLRIVRPAHFTTKGLSYGRLGEPSPSRGAK
jgi:hypothetical protein